MTGRFALSLAVAFAALAGAPPPALAGQAPPDEAVHLAPHLRDTSFELLDYRCTSELGRRQVTLFGNGTVRVWEGLWDDQRMSLGELRPDELDGALRRLAAVDLGEVSEGMGVSGDWVERCEIRLDLGGGARVVRFVRYESLPLAVDRLVRIADDLATTARSVESMGLPHGYEPRVGDVLRRVDDALFEIKGTTADGKGLELQGVEQPLTLYLAPGQLREYFVALERRRRVW